MPCFIIKNWSIRSKKMFLLALKRQQWNTDERIFIKCRSTTCQEYRIKYKKGSCTSIIQDYWGTGHSLFWRFWQFCIINAVFFHCDLNKPVSLETEPFWSCCLNDSTHAGSPVGIPRTLLLGQLHTQCIMFSASGSASHCGWWLSEVRIRAWDFEFSLTCVCCEPITWQP